MSTPNNNFTQIITVFNNQLKNFVNFVFDFRSPTVQKNWCNVWALLQHCFNWIQTFGLRCNVCCKYLLDLSLKRTFCSHTSDGELILSLKDSPLELFGHTFEVWVCLRVTNIEESPDTTHRQNDHWMNVYFLNHFLNTNLYSKTYLIIILN